MIKKVFPFLLAIIGILVIGVAIAQVDRKSPKIETGVGTPGGHNALIEAAKSIFDPRMVDVEKPCKAEEVSVAAGEWTTSGQSEVSCEKAKEDCQKQLTKVVYSKADDKCKLYEKAVRENPPQCNAYRGNLNPDENIVFGECGKFPGEEKLLVVSCWLKEKVKYTCN